MDEVVSMSRHKAETQRRPALGDMQGSCSLQGGPGQKGWEGRRQRNRLVWLESVPELTAEPGCSG